jgi:p-aminobenzoyl-glutamate transporter AbgT
MASAAVKQAEIRYRLYGRIIETTGSIIHRAIPWAGVALIAYFAYLSIRVLAGQETFARIVVRFLADFRVNEYVAYLFGIGGIVYGLGNRKLRKDNIERMAQRIKDLESLLDPRRSSSRLTPRGETRPEDKP